MNGSREQFTRPPEAKYSPVAEMATVRMLFALAAALGHQVLQADFKNAYLNEFYDEAVSQHCFTVTSDILSYTGCCYKFELLRRTLHKIRNILIQFRPHNSL